MTEINLEDSALKKKALVKIAGKDTGLWDCPGKGLRVWVHVGPPPPAVQSAEGRLRSARRAQGQLLLQLLPKVDA